MRSRSVLAAWALLAIVTSCSEIKLRPGYCERDGDCPVGQRCLLEGAATFTCVATDGGPPDGDGSEVAAECSTSAECPAEKPICDARACRPCDTARPGDGLACASRDSARPLCGSNGSCVECVSATSADCAADPAKPICDVISNTCVRCSTDDQCVAKAVVPGICMSHQDGRCATDSEVIYVENKAGCASSAVTPMAGSASTPFCGPQLAFDNITSNRRVIVVSGTVTGLRWIPSNAEQQVGVFGRNAAVIAGGVQPAVTITAGADLYLRGPLTIGPGPEIGISAAAGAVLRADGLTVDANRKGGILLDGAGFDIRNTTVAGNGPGDIMGFPWGGIRIQNPPSAGPALLGRLTIRDNDPVGLSCSSAIAANGILATDNTSVNIAASCGIVSCSPAGPTCGAQ